MQVARAVVRGTKAAAQAARMSDGVSVVVPVKDGARYLEELLAAVRAEGADEVLVIDSGSSDGSLEIARARGRAACSRSRPASSATGARATSARSARAAS